MDNKNILFVDDEENIISGLTRQLRPFRNQWNLFYALSGKEALEIMAQQPIDLIVSDMMMPEMKGDELLKKVRDLYPATVRIVLSGYADEETLKSGLLISHQYLSKPCSAEILRESISQVFKIQDCVNDPRVIAGIGDPQKLPSLPQVYLDLNKAIEDENTSVKDIAQILSSDMVLSAKLLRLINSPYFGINRLISNLNEAINLIGIKKLNSLVLSVHIKNVFPVNNPVFESYMEYLWQDAGRVSELAQLIALSENQKEDRPDQAYLGGLLHNLGLLIFMSRDSDKLKTLIEQVKNTDIPVAELEMSIFGFTRSQGAAYLLSLWKIPPRIIESVLLQHTPNDTDYEDINALTAVHAASCLLKPSVMTECDRLFDMGINMDYLERINKLDRLPEWQSLAEKILTQYANK